MDTLINFIISIFSGLLSGFLSGIIVTKVYRKIDSNRKHDIMIKNTRIFISHFRSLDPNNIGEVCKFLQFNDPPSIYVWSPLNEEERNLFKKLNDILSKLERNLSNYYKNQTATTFYVDLIKDAQREASLISSELLILLVNKYFPKD